ncbi:MAG: ABC transporter permease [Cyclobacteriaceae bacterium]|nr:ABC transporter permease [Cyclobacteriaceae bacterium]
MIEDSKHKPPRWAEKLLSWYCKPELLEDLQGDLNEYFQRNVKAKGVKRAKLIYIIDVFKFFRLYTIRKPKFVNLLIQWIMIGSYIKTSGRNIVRNKLFSSINIIGLAVSMSVGLLLISMLSDIYSYDKFNEHHARIYRVLSRFEFNGDKSNNFMATTSIRAGQAIDEKLTGQEAVAIFRAGFEGDMSFDDKALPLRGFWANENLFSVFTFPLIEGDPNTALKEPFSVVLTEESAMKLFGSTDVVGKILYRNKDKAYTVTGVMKDVPRFSHMRFQMLGSLSTRAILLENEPREQAWDNIWQTWVYLLIPGNVNLEQYQASLDQLSNNEGKDLKNIHIQFRLQPMDDIMLGERLGNQIGQTMGSTMAWVFTGLAFVVMLSACFNYTNLSIARSIRRYREVGVRKVIGALSRNVRTQFLFESMVISLLSLVAAFGLFLLLRPHLIGLEADMQELFVLELSPMVVVAFILFALLVGIAAGFVPALHFSHINAIQAMKNIAQIGGAKKLTGRKVLIVFQYCLSLILIIGTVLIYKQYQYYLNYDLGFSSENIINIRLQGNKAAPLKKILNEMPEVKAISTSVLLNGLNDYWGSDVKNPENPQDSSFVFANKVDENFIPLHEYQLLTGRNFIPKAAEDAREDEVIVNEALLKRFNLGDKNSALGETILVEGNELKIIGVVHEFQYGRVANQTANEVMIRYTNREAEYLNVKIESTDLVGTYDKIAAHWKKLDNVHPFEANFYDHQIEESFRGLKASIKLAGFISFLAISIASLGLLGMVVFTSEMRMREVSIRKVMGASEANLIILLGRNFVALLAISAAISLPLTYWLFRNVMQTRMVHKAPLSYLDGVIAVTAVLVLACIMISSQTWKVARTNPAEVLKSE